jgi:hypothetical protein
MRRNLWLMVQSGCNRQPQPYLVFLLRFTYVSASWNPIRQYVTMHSMSPIERLTVFVTALSFLALFMGLFIYTIPD